LWPPFAFDYKTPGVLETPWRMSQATGAHKDLSFADLYHLARRTLRFEVQFHIPLDLIKELVAWFDVKIEPRVGPAQHHHEKVLVMNQKAIGSKRRIEIIFVRFNPML
jgi:hypothetical protein